MGFNKPTEIKCGECGTKMKKVRKNFQNKNASDVFECPNCGTLYCPHIFY